MSLAQAISNSLFSPEPGLCWCVECDGCGNGHNVPKGTKGAIRYKRGKWRFYAMPCEECKGTGTLPRPKGWKLSYY